MTTAPLIEAFRDELEATATAAGDSIIVHLRGGPGSSPDSSSSDVEYRLGIELPQRAMETTTQLLCMSTALVAGQAALTARVQLRTSLDPSAAATAIELARLLYASHAYAQGLATWPTPRIDYDRSGSSMELSPNAPDPKRAVLLWSGGKDSLAALEVLRLNGFEVLGLHATANEPVADLERKAAQHLAELNDLPLLTVGVSWPIVKQLLTFLSTSSAQFPLANSIPHGRDLPLVVVAAALAHHWHASYVVAGYEYDLWHKEVTHHGYLVARHDIQSRQAGVLLDRLLHDAFGVRFFSPIAAFRERAILVHLLRTQPDAWSHIASCSWRRWCGECPKCLRYALTQATIGSDLIDFEVNPLDPERAALGNLLTAVRDRTRPYWEQQIHDLFLLFEAGHFADAPQAAALISHQWAWYEAHRSEVALQLADLHPDTLAPSDFRWTLGAQGKEEKCKRKHDARKESSV